MAVALVAVCTVGCATHRAYGDVDVSSGPVNVALGRETLQSRSSEGVGVIETDVGRGLGFVVDAADGYLLTNRHVVEDAEHVEAVEFPASHPPRRFESVEIVYMDPGRDLALLKVHTDRPLPEVPLASSRLEPIQRYLQRKDPVVVLQQREGGFMTSNGAVHSLAVYNRAAGPGAFVGVSNPVVQGQSGGPVLDRYGRAVGIVTWTWRDRAGGFAIPIGEAHRMLAERPQLDDAGERMGRAKLRSRRFFAALGRGDVEEARKMTSPSHARRIRESTVSEILGTLETGGLSGMQGFIGALESVVTAGGDEPSKVHTASRLETIIERTGTDGFRDALGLTDRMDPGQVVSFFYEFGHAYVAARSFGGLSPKEALVSALQRLHTVDAARTFALAEMLSKLAGNSIEIQSVQVIPGAYAPRAVVALRTMKSTPVGESVPVQTELSQVPMTLHLKLEWGDWYVAELAPTPLANGEPSTFPRLEASLPHDEAVAIAEVPAAVGEPEPEPGVPVLGAADVANHESEPVVTSAELSAIVESSATKAVAEPAPRGDVVAQAALVDDGEWPTE